MRIREYNKNGYMSVWYIEPWRLSINEGGVPGLHIDLSRPRYFYLRWAGWRFYWIAEGDGPTFERDAKWPGWLGYWRLRRYPREHWWGEQ